MFGAADSNCPTELIPVTNMSLDDLNRRNAEFWAERSLDDEASMSNPRVTEEALRIMTAEANIGIPMRERSNLSAALDIAAEQRKKLGAPKWWIARTLSGTSRIGGPPTTRSPTDPISIAVEARLRQVAAAGSDNSAIITQTAVVAPLVAAGTTATGSSANFRSCAHSICVKELKRFRALARKMQKLIHADPAGRSFQRVSASLRDVAIGLRQPTILALAQFGMTGERGRLRDGAIEPGDLDTATWAADEAINWLANVQKSNPSYIDLGLTSGRGRPVSARARVFARVLYTAYVKLAGRRPTLTVRPERDKALVDGPFFQLVKDIFDLARIDASPEAMARLAIKDMAAG